MMPAAHFAAVERAVQEDGWGAGVKPASEHEDPLHTHPGADAHSACVSRGVQNALCDAVVVPDGVPVVPVVVVVVVVGIVGRVVGTHATPVHIQPATDWQVVDDVPALQLAGVVLGLVGVVELFVIPHDAGGFGTLQSIVAAPLPGPRAGAPPPELWDLQDVIK